MRTYKEVAADRDEQERLVALAELDAAAAKLRIVELEIEVGAVFASQDEEETNE
jgi:hypothetical protein